jgi:hypothetical protein
MVNIINIKNNRYFDICWSNIVIKKGSYKYSWNKRLNYEKEDKYLINRVKEVLKSEL